MSESTEKETQNIDLVEQQMMKDLAQQEPLDSSFKGDVSKIDIKTSPKPEHEHHEEPRKEAFNLVKSISKETVSEGVDTIEGLKKEITNLKQKLEIMRKAHNEDVRELKDFVERAKERQVKKDIKKRILKGSFTKEVYEGHKGGVYSLQYDGHTLVTGSGDRTVRVWDTTTQECTHVLSGHTSGVCCLSYSDSRVISGSWDKTIRIWDLKSGESKVLRAHVNGVRCLQVKGNTMVSGASDKIIFVWNLEQAQCELILKGHDSGVYCLEFQDTKLVSGSGDKTMRIWDMNTGKCNRIIRGHLGEIYTLKFERNMLVSGSGDKTLRIWDAETSECLRAMIHPDAVYSCSIIDNLLVTGCGDNRLRFWDVRTGECLRVINAHTDGVYSLQFQGDTLASGSVDKTAVLWKFNNFYLY